MSLNNQSRKPSGKFDFKDLIEVVFLVFFFGILIIGFLYHKTIPHSEIAGIIQTPAATAILESKGEAPGDSGQDEIKSDIRACDLVDVNPNAIHPPEAPAMNTRAVSPPLPSADIACKTETVLASIGMTITSEKHTMIYIPPDAFVDSSGKTVKGDVKVRYREFHNYADILLSGIPMKYDAAHQLESAGMIEITASKDNTPLYVNNANKIHVMLASMNKSTDFGIYYFDKKQNKWIDKGRDIVNGSTSVYGSSNVTYVEDSTRARFTFKAENYTVKPVGNGFVEAKRKSFFSRKMSPAKFTFHFAASDKAAPETRLISRFRWKYTGDDVLRTYNRMLRGDGRKIKSGNPNDTLANQWRNVAIAPNEDGISYLLTMYGSGDTLSATITPELSSERSIMSFKESFDAFVLNQHSRLEKEWAELQKFQKDTADYYAANGHYIRTRQALQTYATRQFAIDGFGIWNCDRPMSLPTAAVVNATFINEQGTTVQPEIVYVIDKSLNTVFSFSGRDYGRFRFDPGADNMICAVLPGGRIGVIKPKEFHERYKRTSGDCTFMLNESKIISSGNEVRNLLAFK